MARPVVLCILDGWGLSETRAANAPVLAETPVFDRLMETCPQARLTTHGPAVGLPEGQMGNSEVGHTTIGAGRVVWMDLPRISNAITDGSYASNPALRGFVTRLKQTGGTAHLMGVLSDGGVHGHVDHMAATADLIEAAGVPVCLHLMTDGRDVPPKSALEFLPRIDAHRIGTVTGRYFAMDRDNRWDRVARAFAAMAQGTGEAAETPEAAIRAAYETDRTDEFIPPTVIRGYDGMRPGDGLFCLNFRADRAREILAAFADPEFTGFEALQPELAARLGMVSYSDAHDAWYETAFSKEHVKNTLGAWISAHGLRQFHVAETEKYPHVTFFLNGGEEAPFPGETRHMAPSPKVATYDLAPEMSAAEVAEHLARAIRDRTDFAVVNFANPDMVGHTGDLAAAMAACEAVDKGLGQALEALEEVGGAMIVTADHGNCEVMVDPETGGPHTAHTTNPVPVLLVGGPAGARLRDGELSDLAPTVLDLMGLDLPPEMTGRSLLS